MGASNAPTPPMVAGMDLISTVSIWLLPVLIAITFHEAAHGYVARFLGDDTASRLGRVSLNPVRHNYFTRAVAYGSITILVWIRQTSAGQLSGTSSTTYWHGACRGCRTSNEYRISVFCRVGFSPYRLPANRCRSMGRPESKERPNHQCRPRHLQSISSAAT